MGADPFHSPRRATCHGSSGRTGRERLNGGGKDAAHTTRIIACGAFRPALETLKLEERYPDVHVTFLSSNLHVWPDKLKRRLSREVRKAQRNTERVIASMGSVFPALMSFVNAVGSSEPPCFIAMRCSSEASNFMGLWTRQRAPSFWRESSSLTSTNVAWSPWSFMTRKCGNPILSTTRECSMCANHQTLTWSPGRGSWPNS